MKGGQTSAQSRPSRSSSSGRIRNSGPERDSAATHRAASPKTGAATPTELAPCRQPGGVARSLGAGDPPRRPEALRHKPGRGSLFRAPRFAGFGALASSVDAKTSSLRPVHENMKWT